MLKIEEDGDIFVNGQYVGNTNGEGNSISTKKQVIIRNGEVVHNDFEEADFDPFSNDFFKDPLGFMKNMGSSKSKTKISCPYCGSSYLDDNTNCPNCGAPNKS